MSEDWRPDLIVGAPRETVVIQEASSLLPLSAALPLPCDVLTSHQAGSGTWGRRMRAWFPNLATGLD